MSDTKFFNTLWLKLKPDEKSKLVQFAENLILKREKDRISNNINADNPDALYKFLKKHKGALSDLSDEWTSVELQHKALDWWADDISEETKGKNLDVEENNE